MNNENRNTNPSQLRITCETCSKSFRINTPSKPGNYNVKCPHCATSIKVSIAAPKLSDAMHAPRIKAPVLGEPVKVQHKVYAIKKRAIVGRPYKAVCPDCGNDISLTPTLANKNLKAQCKQCGTVVVYKAVESNANSDDSDATDDGSPAGHKPEGRKKTERLNPPSGALRWKPKGFTERLLKRRDMVGRLKRGPNIVGRKSPDEISDIMIEGDKEMSRRSVEINVKEQAGVKDYIYELRVLRTTNPVFINGRPVALTEVVKLNYGDTIMMGKTSISFFKLKNT